GMLDTMLDAAAIAKSDRVIDIGCGTGASTIAAAGRAPHGEALGVDISEPLLARARSRADSAGVLNTSFLLADAQTHRFSEGKFNVLVSRIGMSFFSDIVSAFRNLALALGDEGRMAFVCWAGVDKNPWFHIPKRVAEQRLGPQPDGDPYAPGPTAFQDGDRVANLMAQAGLSNIVAQAVEIDLTPPGGAEGAARAASRVGPAARIMKAHKGDETDAAAIEEAVLQAFAEFDNDCGVRIPAVVNLFTCTA
ncbi:MAG: class I SAM-dependent methyltransferase, partial [Planctomycetota bacterium]